MKCPTCQKQTTCPDRCVASRYETCDYEKERQVIDECKFTTNCKCEVCGYEKLHGLELGYTSDDVFDCINKLVMAVNELSKRMRYIEKADDIEFVNSLSNRDGI